MPGAMSPIVHAQIKEYAASGMPQVEIAKSLNISTKSVQRSRKANRKDIENLALQYVNESIDLIRDNHFKSLKIANYVLSKTIQDDNGNEVPDLETVKDNKDILSIADKKEFRALQIMGIAPSNTPSIIINQLFTGTSADVLDPAVNRIMQGHCPDLLDDEEALEAEYSETD